MSDKVKQAMDEHQRMEAHFTEQLVETVSDMARGSLKAIGPKISKPEMKSVIEKLREDAVRFLYVTDQAKRYGIAYEQ